MSLDINELVKAIKQAAVEAVRADGPMGVCYGTVTTASPLKIMVDQKKTLTTPQLILTDNVRDFNVVLSTIEGEGKSQGPHYTELESGGGGYAEFASHRHRYQGRKKWRVHNALNVGEVVHVTGVAPEPVNLTLKPDLCAGVELGRCAELCGGCRGHLLCGAGRSMVQLRFFDRAYFSN